mgnify:CR=1 FL=1
MGVCDSKESELSSEPFKTVKSDAVSKKEDIIWNTVPENTSKITKEYKIWMDSIGSGSFGEVRKALHTSTGETRAIKIIYKLQVTNHDQQKIMKEIRILQKTDHPHIVKVYEYFQDHKFIYIVMELVPGGELFSKIQQMQKFTEAQAAKLFFQIVSALNYLHQQKIVHRDIKPENIMLDDNNSIKIIDFGTAREFEPGQKMKNCHGTPYYIAPEVLDELYDEKCDVWSAGIILYILLTGVPPFNGANDEEILSAVREGTVNMNIPQFEGISIKAKDLIKQMLTKNPKNRPSAKTVLEHSWFKEVDSEPTKVIDKKILQNLSNFETKSQLQRAIYFFMINNLVSKDEKKELTEIFQRLDTNNDGVISRDELYMGFQAAELPGLTAADIENLMDKIDSNKSKAIDYSEFLAAAMDRKKMISKERIKKVFTIFDKDGNGKISPNEFKNIFKGAAGIKEEVWLEMIKEIDQDGNGEIDYDEFEDLLFKMVQN